VLNLGLSVAVLAGGAIAAGEIAGGVTGLTGLAGGLSSEPVGAVSGTGLFGFSWAVAFKLSEPANKKTKDAFDIRCDAFSRHVVDTSSFKPTKNMFIAFPSQRMHLKILHRNLASLWIIN